MVNVGDETALKPKWVIALSNYTNQYYPHYQEDPQSSEPLPIPTTEIDDYIKGHSQNGNFEIFNDHARQFVKSGDRVFGVIAIGCMNCAAESKFWFYWKVGEGGWFALFTPLAADAKLFKEPSLSNDEIDALIDRIVPLQSRIRIQDGKGAQADLTQP
jgi:hypothetical protein